MKCPRCQHDNPQGARFCEECATPLARTCSNCGTALSATAKFCHACAHPVTAGVGAPPRSPDSYTPKHLAEKILTSKAALEGERKQVTVLFADLKGSMELLADRDPEEARWVLDPVLKRMMEAVHHYEGTVNQVMGDGIMALFGAPLAHEDHAVRAYYWGSPSATSCSWPRRSRYLFGFCLTFVLGAIGAGSASGIRPRLRAGRTAGRSSTAIRARRWRSFVDDGAAMIVASTMVPVLTVSVRAGARD